MEVEGLSPSVADLFSITVMSLQATDSFHRELC